MTSTTLPLASSTEPTGEPIIVQQPNENDALFSPRSAAAMALSSFASQSMTQQQQPQRRPTNLFRVEDTIPEEEPVLLSKTTNEKQQTSQTIHHSVHSRPASAPPLPQQQPQVTATSIFRGTTNAASSFANATHIPHAGTVYTQTGTPILHRTEHPSSSSNAASSYATMPPPPPTAACAVGGASYNPHPHPDFFPPWTPPTWMNPTNHPPHHNPNKQSASSSSSVQQQQPQMVTSYLVVTHQPPPPNANVISTFSAPVMGGGNGGASSSSSSYDFHHHPMMQLQQHPAAAAVAPHHPSQQYSHYHHPNHPQQHHPRSFVVQPPLLSNKSTLPQYYTTTTSHRPTTTTTTSTGSITKQPRPLSSFVTPTPHKKPKLSQQHQQQQQQQQQLLTANEGNNAVQSDAPLSADNKNHANNNINNSGHLHQPYLLIPSSHSCTGEPFLLMDENNHHHHHHHAIIKPPSSSSSSSKYNRKKKSLGVLAETFLIKFTGQETLVPPQPLADQLRATILAPDGVDIVIDQLAEDLQIERRRIYDVVNILEAVQIVVKKGKNTYQFMGQEHLSRAFAILQNDAIAMWPNEAIASGLWSPSHDDEHTTGTPTTTRTIIPNQNNKSMSASESSKNKSLTNLSQMFLQVFLTGLEDVSLPHASDLISGSKSTVHDLAVLGCKDGEPVPSDPKLFQQAAARGLKTKIRRLYDIANVFMSVGLLTRAEDKHAKTVEGKRPRFFWSYGLSVKEIRQLWLSMPERMKTDKVPFDEVPPILENIARKNRIKAGVADSRTTTSISSEAIMAPYTSLTQISPTSSGSCCIGSGVGGSLTVDESEEKAESVMTSPSSSCVSVPTSGERRTEDSEVLIMSDSKSHTCLRSIHMTGGAVNSVDGCESDDHLRRVSLSQHSMD